MPSVLDRSALEQSPLADLHLLANELGVDGFRRLRKPDLVDAILSRQSGEAVGDDATSSDDDQPKRSRRGRRGGRGRRRDEDDGGNGREDRDRDERPAGPSASAESREERVVEGAVELLSNGSGFLRLSPPDSTDDDVYISAAQVKRCELVAGDRVAGPMRPARRSERFPSLIRVDTINGRPAEEVAEGTRFEELPVAWPAERIALRGDAAVEAIAAAAPFGKGSRVILAGPSRSGKSEVLRRLATALSGVAGLELSAVLTGVRPEEIADFPVAPGAALNFSASVDAQAQAVEQAVEVGRRVASRGGDAVLLIDGFEYLPAGAARRALAAGRNLAGGGSLTVIATAPTPIGGETTVVVLDRAGTFPALVAGETGTLRPELLKDAPEPAPEPEPAAVVVTPAAEEAPAPAKQPAGRARKRAPKPAAAAKKPAAAAKKPAAAAKKPAAAAKKPAAAAKKPAAAAKKPAAKRKPAAKKRAAG
jgi:transcription termination factor Rho